MSPTSPCSSVTPEKVNHEKDTTGYTQLSICYNESPPQREGGGGGKLETSYSCVCESAVIYDVVGTGDSRRGHIMGTCCVVGTKVRTLCY